MKEKMLSFVCQKESHLIVKITKQKKRAEDMMYMYDGLYIYSYNISCFPSVLDLKVGDCLNEYEIEKSRVF